MASLGRKMNVTNSTFLANLVVRGGDAFSGSGGAIWNGAVLNLSNSTITANTASDYGAGFINDGGN